MVVGIDRACSFDHCEFHGRTIGECAWQLALSFPNCYLLPLSCASLFCGYPSSVRSHTGCVSDASGGVFAPFDCRQSRSNSRMRSPYVRIDGCSQLSLKLSYRCPGPRP